MRGAQLQRPAWAPARVMLEGLSLEWTCGFDGIHGPIQVRAAKAFLAGEAEPEDKNAQTSSVLTGGGAEGGAEVQAVLMPAPCLPLLVEPQVSLREAVSEWDPAGQTLTSG